MLKPAEAVGGVSSLSEEKQRAGDGRLAFVLLIFTSVYPPLPAFS